MGKFFFKSFLVILTVIAFIIIFLTYYGIETKRFNYLIQNKANEVNQNVKLEFEKTKIHLNFTEFNLVVKLKDPKIIIKGNTINLSKLDLFLSLKSFFSSDFLLKRAEVAFVKNDIKDLTKITNIFLPRIFNKQLKKIFASGNLEGEIVIPFKADGTVDKNYAFSGKVYEAKINLTKDFSIKNLTTEISYGKKGNNFYSVKIQKGLLFAVDLTGSTIVVKREENKTKINTVLKTNGKFNFNQIKKISSLFNLNLNFFDEIDGDANLSTHIDFDLNKKFRVNNLTYFTKGNIAHLRLHTKKKDQIKKYLPKYDPVLIFKDTKINFKNKKSGRITELDGFIKTGDKFDSFKITEKYNYKKKNFDISGNIDLTNSAVKITRLNYYKDIEKKASIFFDINFILNTSYNINELEFLNDNSRIYLSDFKLNKNLAIDDFKKLEIKTYSNKIKNNDIFVNKSDKIIISGEIFDAQPLLKSLYKKSETKTLSNKFNAELKINFDKTVTGTNDDISDFAMIASIKKGSYEKLSLKGNFSQDEIVEMSIYQVDKDKKTLQVLSDRARPFIKNFDFIKGFEGGKLEYESFISNKISNSNLKITDFKVSKVPALAQLLTLASLQGIADTLSGEGIRFESFEMKSNSKGNVLNVEEALALGPAVSILLEGYVDKGKTVSLRGTLVPATKLNSIIASIPVVGDILVGKKTGEGVVGVSFKMKGPPKDIKTSVNPIKTLTPRFIVRAVEKMKKQKKEETK